ncbi:transcription factor Tfb4 [Sistotremastrum niveocremeum HHB9708]|uniref:General transcription and DNA repair factor IIH subunit TFB4 n=1 Tax=Sistotremastrum niveocremeum HHB9708 TaxID=1314777 RepID=A0A164V9N9_9AGAM|nr:transcription factor Tfb4 [Sistotremastrum niveocremeum HHB9708]
MSHLSLLLDLQPAAWHDPTQSLQFSTFLAHILVFLNAHLAQKHENSLAIFGAFPGKSIMLYSSIDQTKPADRRVQPDPNWYQPFKTLDAALTERIREEMPQPSNSSEAEEPLPVPVALVGALAKALCCKSSTYCNFNRIIQATKVEAPSDTPLVMPESRILIVSVSPDAAASYIPLMNSIFSAQKLKVVIDVCKIYGPDTTFLQQAAYLTGGSYIRMCFLQPPSVRSLLAVPTTDRVDFRAACFCHKDIIDAGYVCSVCLSIFCQPVPVCSTCRYAHLSTRLMRPI